MSFWTKVALWIAPELRPQIKTRKTAKAQTPKAPKAPTQPKAETPRNRSARQKLLLGIPLTAEEEARLAPSTIERYEWARKQGARSVRAAKLLRRSK